MSLYFCHVHHYVYGLTPKTGTTKRPRGIANTQETYISPFIITMRAVRGALLLHFVYLAQSMWASPRTNQLYVCLWAMAVSYARLKKVLTNGSRHWRPIRFLFRQVNYVICIQFPSTNFYFREKIFFLCEKWRVLTLINSAQHSKYHCCWCPGSLRR